MRNYYVVDCISGCTEGVEPLHSIAEARELRDKWNAERKAEGGSEDFWVIINGSGKEVQ